MTNPTVWPTHVARDVPALLDFLVRAFGFVQTARYEHEGTVVHAELLRPDGRGGLMLGSAATEGAWPQQPGSFAAYVVLDTAEVVEQLHARAVAAGAEVLQAPHDTDYGSHEAAYRDPEGGLWSFGTHRGSALPD